MTAVPAGIAAELGQQKLNVALSVIKQSAQADQAIAEILEENARSAPLSRTHGSHVNLSA